MAKGFRQIGRWLSPGRRKWLQEQARMRLADMVSRDGLGAVADRLGVLKSHLREVVEGGIPPGPHLAADVGFPFSGRSSTSGLPTNCDEASMWDVAHFCLRLLKKYQASLSVEIRELLPLFAARLRLLKGPYCRKKARQNRWRRNGKSAG